MNKKTDFSYPDGQETSEVLSKNTSKQIAAANLRKSVLNEGTKNFRIKIEEMDCNSNEIAGSKENNVKIKTEEADRDYNAITDSKENIIRVKVEDGINEEMQERNHGMNHGDADFRREIARIVKEAVSEWVGLNDVNINEPPQEKTRKSWDEFSVLISNAPFSTTPDVTITALQGIVGKEKVSNICELWKLQPVSQSFSKVFRANVSDSKTLKLLVELKPKLRINGQELTIEENKITKTEKETRMVFISKIPVHACDERTVVTALEAKIGKGKVFTIRFPEDRRTGRPKGLASACCASVEMAKRLLRFDSKIKIAGKKIKIVEYRPSKRRKITVLKVFVSNLPAKANGAECRAKILDVVGRVDFLEIEFAPVNNGSKLEDSALINLTSEKAMRKLLALHQVLEIGGNKVNVLVYQKDRLHTSDLGCEIDDRDKDRTENKLNESRNSADNTRQCNVSDSFQNNPEVNHGPGCFRCRNCVCTSSRSLLSQNQGFDHIYRDWQQRTHESVHTNYGFSNINQAQSQRDCDTFNMGWGQSSLASESGYSSDSSNVTQGWNYQGHDNLNRWEQRDNERLCDNSGFGRFRGWHSQGHDNINRVDWTERL